MLIVYTPENVALQNVTEIKGVHVTGCLISNRMIQTMQSHKTQSDLLLLQSNLNVTIVHCYNECLIHVSQARYRLTINKKNQLRSEIY
jgi:hypothetical protein